MTIRSSGSVALISSALLAIASLAVAGDRPVEEILADYRAVELPKFTGDPKDIQALRKFREEHHKADVRRGELALELFQAHPDHEQVPGLLLARWPSTMMDPATAGATVTEIDRAMPHFQDARQARTALYMRSIATVVANRANPDAAMPAVEDFIRRDPKDPRSAMLLAGFADGVKDLAFRTRLLRRLVEEYPDAPASKSAAATLALLDKVGKPLDLEFVDAIKGETVSIKGLRGKVVVLDFWATWCGPCVAEMPTMKKLYAEYKDKGVEFIGVSLDHPREEGGLDKLKAFVARNEIAWPQYYQGNGFESEFSSGLGIGMIPQVFLVDAEGNLASVNARGRLETLLPEYLARAKSSTRP
jgi:thiol-disulfide isomerase/thioredoxin